MFTIVTSVPAQLNFEENDRPSLLTDSITLKAFFERWGFLALKSLVARVDYQIEKLRAKEEANFPEFRIIDSRKKLDEFVEYRKSKNPQAVAGLLGIEGLHCLVSSFYPIVKKISFPKLLISYDQKDFTHLPPCICLTSFIFSQRKAISPTLTISSTWGFA